MEEPRFARNRRPAGQRFGRHRHWVPVLRRLLFVGWPSHRPGLPPGVPATGPTAVVPGELLRVRDVLANRVRRWPSALVPVSVAR
jgi:hypothetical protein